MARLLARRFPAMRLVEYVTHGRTNDDGRPLGSAVIGPELGVEAVTIRNWKHRGTMLTIWAADKHATKLGVHPSVIWPEYWDIEADYCDTSMA